jgi:hypothetical protein
MRIRLLAKIAFAGFLLQVFPLRSGQSLSTNYDSIEASQSTNSTVLSLRFVRPTHSFAADGPIEIQAVLKNEGSQTILVCRDLRVGTDNSQPCAWEFSVRDASGRNLPGPGCASMADRGWTSRDDFAKDLIESWMALSPGYSYSTPINVARAFCYRPSPGRYEITGVLTSYGLDSPSINNPLAAYPHEIEKLPYTGWKGTIGSNKIWITIEPRNGKSR